MLRRFLAFSLHNAGLVVLGSVGLVALTFYTFQRLPVDVFPELNAPTVTLLTEAGGLSAEEVEQYVTFPIESAVNGLPGLRRVRSASALGLSIVWAEFGWGVDIYRARQMVSERLSAVMEELPPEVHAEMAPIGSITGEILLISLHAEGPDVSPLDLRAVAEYDLRNRLLTVAGISQVVAIGGHLPEYQVEFRQEALQLYDLTSADVARALAGAHNLNSAGFLANHEGRELPLRQSGRVRSVGDIELTVVAHREGAPVTVADVAEVKKGGAFRRGAASDNGVPAVVLSIQKAPGTNTLALTEEIDALLDQVEPSLPAGVHLNRHVFRQADFIARSVDNVTDVLIEATVIVSLVLVLFLMNLRTTLITLTALPVSLAVTLLVMWAFDMTINVMTLGGLAVAIGILVDDAIIDVENVHRRLLENRSREESDRQPRMRVIFDASNEIRSSVVYATLIICVVFVPLLFLQGLEGRFFRPLGITYILSVLASLVVAMTLTPALCWFLLRGRLGSERGENRFVRGLKRCYRWLLELCLRFRKTVLAAAALLFVAALGLAASFGSSFLPEFNEGVYTVFLMMPPGTSLDESERVALRAEQELLAIDGVEHVVARSGRAERDEHAEPPSNSEIELRLVEDADPRAVLAAVDIVLADIPGLSSMVGQPMGHRLSHVMSGTSAQIAINVFGPDLRRLRQAASEIEAAVEKLPGTRDVVAGREVLVRTLAIDFRLRDLARYGLNAEEAGAQVKRALFGEDVAVINQGAWRYDLVLRLVEEQRRDVKNVEDVVLTGSEGALVRLHEVADIGPERAPALISREGTQRKTVISANVADGHNLGDTVAAIREVVDPIVSSAGLTAQYGGQFEAQRSAERTILWMGALILVALFALLQVALGGDRRGAVLVMANLPLALIGGVIAVFVAESPDVWANAVALLTSPDDFQAPVLSIASIVGFVTLFGIAVRNGILLVNHFRWLMDVEGLSLADAVRRGSEERLVPVLMTALSAALGLAPLALKMGQPGSEILAPLAVVVLGGLVTSTLLNMLIVPVGYLIIGPKEGRKPSDDPEWDPLT